MSAASRVPRPVEGQFGLAAAEARMHLGPDHQLRLVVQMHNPHKQESVAKMRIAWLSAADVVTVTLAADGTARRRAHRRSSEFRLSIPQSSGGERGKPPDTDPKVDPITRLRASPTAELALQVALWLEPGPRRQPRAARADHSRSKPFDAATYVGARLHESPRPRSPGAMRAAPDAPHSR